jgi:maltose alpha-D-glucosyltransferase/alpha-amylase
VELDLSRFKGMVPVEMTGTTEFPRIGELPYFLTLGGYAFYWFKLQHAAAPLSIRVAPESAVDVHEPPALFMGAAWDTLLDGNVRTLIERDLLGPFLQRQRWFGAKTRMLRAARFRDWGLLRRSPQPLFLTIVDAEFEDGGSERYFLPLTICPAADVRALQERDANAILASITGARKGVLFDGWLDDRFARQLLEAIERREQVKARHGSLRTRQTPAFAEARGEGALAPRRARSEQSNTSLIFGDRLILKLLRRVEPGINPDFEIGLHLTTKVHFDRAPAIAGAIELDVPGEDPWTLAVLQQFVESQADGWTHATEEARRFFETVENRQLRPPNLPRVSYGELMMMSVPAAAADAIGGYLSLAGKLGRRTGELHLFLAADASDPAFAPEPFTADDLRALSVDAAGQAQAALAALERHQELGRELLAKRELLLERIHQRRPLEFSSSKIRVHGDYHLGQVLWAEGDFYLLDFEGEPARPLSERRMKQSPLKDVAGMVRSFGYAAYAGLFAHTASRPASRDLLAAWAPVWETWTAATFLRGYFDTVEPARFVPQEPAQRDALLRLFVLDKALYELNYELNNRPDWVRIPLAGIMELLRPLNDDPL